MSMLEQIKSPNDVKELNLEQLQQLSDEVRQRLIDVISKNGGHLASNLGAVELTIGLHKVFDSPNDAIVWDVGHQSYTHKILTGRNDVFDTLRQEGGISGYPRPLESEHDSFIAGHSSTSISVACGIAKANRLMGNPDRQVIAVIGDGALTGGLSYEALNNAGRSPENLIVIVNHNEMSISKNVGAFARYLSNIRFQKGYVQLKDRIENLLDQLNGVGKPIKKLLTNSKSVFKHLLLHDNFFEALGFQYFGPVDGHNLEDVISVLQRAKQIKGPVLIQMETVKGKGYCPAEKNPGAYHGISKFDVETGNPDMIDNDSFSMTFGNTLTALAQADQSICAITAAMTYGTGLQHFKKQFPQRFFDVGIAEAHAVTFCAAMASKGMIPVFAVYSSFLQRSYDQLVHDVSIAQQHIVLAVDRAGIVGEDGETHQGLLDSAFLTTIPNTTIYAPSTYREVEVMVKQAIYDTPHLAVVRYPRGKENGAFVSNGKETQPFVHEKKGGNTVLVSYGKEFCNVYQAYENLQREGKTVSYLKLNRIWPIADALIDQLMQYQTVLFFEEGVQEGGIGQKVMLGLYRRGWNGTFDLTAIEDPFVPQAKMDRAIEKLGLDSNGIVQKAKQYL